MSDLAKLIERLEEASEGSRELDAKIWCAIHEVEFSSVHMSGTCFWFKADESTDAAGWERDRTGPSYCRRELNEPWQSPNIKNATPFYTFRIDDALLTVPNGWNRHLLSTAVDGIYQHTANISSSDAVFESGEGYSRKLIKGHWGSAIQKPTAPLALCIAALRARGG